MSDDENLIHGRTVPPDSLSLVVRSGACVGCGACSVITNGRVPMRRTAEGIWQADPSVAGPAVRDLGAVACPWADGSPDEDVISSELYGDLPSDPRVGRYLETFAAQVNDDGYLEGSSSGGLTSWILVQLMERDLIDGVVHVGAGGSDNGLFSYQVSTTVGELTARRKSMYYSTSMDQALFSIRGDGKRYALVGVPCFITAGRLVAKNDEVLRSQLIFYVGLVCGHLKSAAFAQLLAWQIGIAPQELAAVDFRVKNRTRDAGSYDFQATSLNGEVRSEQSRRLLGGNWGHALFQLDACNYCDDIFAETADLVLGDAWLPEFVSDWRGHNVVVTRNQTLAMLLDQGVETGALTVHPLGVERAAETQAGNFRHRREGLQLRLFDDRAEGKWVPRKRVVPSGSLPRRRRAIVRARRHLSSASHVLFSKAMQEQSLERFSLEIQPLIEAYERTYRVSLLRRATGWGYRKLRRAFMSRR